MSTHEDDERDEFVRNIRKINNRHAAELAAEKWWYMWARGAAGVVFTLFLALFVKYFL
ncbi:MAG: hypothetical protein AAFO61_07025 [Pseudomonadota bacterium]